MQLCVSSSAHQRLVAAMPECSTCDIERGNQMLVTENVNARNFKVFTEGRFIGWITRSDYLMGEPRWGFKDPTGALPETGWNYRSVAECLAAVAA